MIMNLARIRKEIRESCLRDDLQVLERLQTEFSISKEDRKAIEDDAVNLIKEIRQSGSVGLMEAFLAEYGLSTDEGIALMCLAEALLRVPDSETMDELIEDKIVPSQWGEHLGHSSSSLVNASTWALMLTGKVLEEPRSIGIAETLRSVVKRLGEPVIRVAAQQAMREMGHQFVLGRSINEALDRSNPQIAKGYTYSYDMLGEAALTARDADKFFNAYSEAIAEIGKSASTNDVRVNPGISIKLSALHPRYDLLQRDRVISELVPRVKVLASLAMNAGLGLNIDAEEANRLDLSLDVIEAVLGSREFKEWDGFGVVVQAYGKRAAPVLDWLHELALQLDRRIMVRLVKGAYWDSEIKQSQIDGVDGFPVFARKVGTDVSYICCAKKLFGMTDRIYPQFATHNAHTVCAISRLAKQGQAFEFQKLHGMGDALYDIVIQRTESRCRIYAPVGGHKDLLAYLVRRLLENGANSAFVTQSVDDTMDPRSIASDPFETLSREYAESRSSIKLPSELFMPERENSAGWDLKNTLQLAEFEHARSQFEATVWKAEPIVAAPLTTLKPQPASNPANPGDHVALVAEADADTVKTALENANEWSDVSAEYRAEILQEAARLYEANSAEIFALLCREAGKTAQDAVAEIREAVDFLRYYSNEGIKQSGSPPRGLFACISPWNFPFAIFTGQIAAALAAGNGVLAKPAEATPAISYLAVKLLHKAGVPVSALQLLPGEGTEVGAALVSDPKVNGVCFTGSTGVAQFINRSMAKNLEHDSILIAETGGLNAMIVDSTALPEQAIQDIIVSAFQSAGQRCSALRILYLQSDIAEQFLEMLFGAIDELVVGDPWDHSIDVGPVIHQQAKAEIQGHIDKAKKEGRLLKQLAAPESGSFVGPAVIAVSGIADLEKEIFGPVLHVVKFEPEEINDIIKDINASGYGLTFGLHTRIDGRVEQMASGIKAGNIYVNRNQIGAIVGSQPFGGEGLSGTGPKAGGPNYVKRFKKPEMKYSTVRNGDPVPVEMIQKELGNADQPAAVALTTQAMPGPTGESNRLSEFPRGKVLCLGPAPEDAALQMKQAEACGCTAISVVPGMTGKSSIDGCLDRKHLAALTGFDAVALWSTPEDINLARQALASREGPLIPLVSCSDISDFCVLERHLCIDTTAAGGNASLLGAQ